MRCSLSANNVITILVIFPNFKFLFLFLNPFSRILLPPVFHSTFLWPLKFPWLHKNISLIFIQNPILHQDVQSVSSKFWSLRFCMLVLILCISILKCILCLSSTSTLYEPIFWLNLKAWFNSKAFQCDLVLCLETLKMHYSCPFDTTYYEKWFLFYWEIRFLFGWYIL